MYNNCISVQVVQTLFLSVGPAAHTGTYINYIVNIRWCNILLKTNGKCINAYNVHVFKELLLLHTLRKSRYHNILKQSRPTRRGCMMCHKQLTIDMEYKDPSLD